MTKDNEHDDSLEDEKAQLQHRMDEARASISHAVEEIKDTVDEQYETVKRTVSGVLDLREEFHKDPLVWSLGALSAGFALGYTLGYAHKNVKSSGKGRSEAAAFADDLVGQLSTVGKNLVLPSLEAKLKESFGVSFSELFNRVGAEGKRGAKRSPTRAGAKKRAGKRRSRR